MTPAGSRCSPAIRLSSLPGPTAVALESREPGGGLGMGNCPQGQIGMGSAKPAKCHHEHPGLGRSCFAEPKLPGMPHDGAVDVALKERLQFAGTPGTRTIPGTLALLFSSSWAQLAFRR